MIEEYSLPWYIHIWIHFDRGWTVCLAICYTWTNNGKRELVALFYICFQQSVFYYIMHVYMQGNDSQKIDNSMCHVVYESIHDKDTGFVLYYEVIRL